jgi:hypothetical protein
MTILSTQALVLASLGLVAGVGAQMLVRPVERGMEECFACS